MKKIIFILSIVLLCVSCSDDDNKNEGHERVRTARYKGRTNLHIESTFDLFNDNTFFYSAVIYNNWGEEGDKYIQTVKGSFTRKGTIITLSELAEVNFLIRVGDSGSNTETKKVNNLSEIFPTEFDINYNKIISKPNDSGISIDGVKDKGI